MIIGFSGKSGVGKDYLASILEDRWFFKRMSFAEPLKRICAELFGWGPWDIGWEKKQEMLPFWGLNLGPDYLTPRAVLQTVGTEIFRKHVHTDFWVMVMARRLSDTADQNVVITDVRFPNEARMIQEMGGKVVRVVRCSAPQLPTAQAEHASETALDVFQAFDGYFVNNKTRQDTIDGLEGLLKRFGCAVRRKD